MRVNELAKELGKTSKEVLDVLQKQNQEVKSHSSNVNAAQIGMVKKAFGGQSEKAAAPAQASAPAAPAAKPAEGEAPKKKIAAVYRPQNSQQRPPMQQRPKNPAARPQGQNPAARPQGQAPAQPARPQNPAGNQSTPASQGGTQAAAPAASAPAQAAPAAPAAPKPLTAQEIAARVQAAQAARDSKMQNNRDGRGQGGFQVNRDG